MCLDCFLLCGIIFKESSVVLHVSINYSSLSLNCYHIFLSSVSNITSKYVKAYMASLISINIVLKNHIRFLLFSQFCTLSQFQYEPRVVIFKMVSLSNIIYNFNQNFFLNCHFFRMFSSSNSFPTILNYFWSFIISKYAQIYHFYS